MLSYRKVKIGPWVRFSTKLACGRSGELLRNTIITPRERHTFSYVVVIVVVVVGKLFLGKEIAT